MGFVCSSVAWDDLEMMIFKKILKGVRRTLHENWRFVLRTVPVPLETIIVACGEISFDWNPQDQEDQDGHTKDRTNMLPWDSCGPDCPVCAEFER